MAGIFGKGTDQVSDAGTDSNGQESLDAAAHNRDLKLNADQEDLSPTGGDPTHHEPTAGDLGVDVDKEQQRNPLDAMYADLHASTSTQVAAAPDSSVQYSSHPIANLTVGPYEFVNSILVLKPEEAAKFDELLESLPLPERRRIYKVDKAKVDELIAARQPAATKEFDSSVGRQALQDLQTAMPKVGTERIDEMTRPVEGFANRPMANNNAPVLMEGDAEAAREASEAAKPEADKADGAESSQG